MEMEIHGAAAQTVTTVLDIAGSFTLDRDTLYRKKWSEFVKSGLYLALVISVMVCALNLGAYGGYFVFSGFLADNISVTAIWGVAVKFILAELTMMVMTVIIVGLWLARANANAKGKRRTLGVSIIFWTYFAICMVALFLFVITLPMFTEWIPYNKLFSQPLQIAYCVYAFVIVYCMIIMAVLKKMRDNLCVWEGTRGPLVALAVVCIVLGAALWIAVICIGFWNIPFAILALTIIPMLVLMSILLFKYRKLMLSI